MLAPFVARSSTRVHGALACAVVIGLLLPGTARAETTGSSSAYGVAADLTLLPLLGSAIDIDAGPTPTASGTAPPAYTDGPNTTASISLSSVPTGSILSTGIVSARASSELPALDEATAQATIDGLGLDVVGLLQLLTLDATTISATSTIDGDCATGLDAIGEATLVDAVAGGTLGGGLVIPTNPPPNTVLLDTLGVRVVLNEQVESGDGVNDLSLVVNAIHVELSVSLVGIGTLGGEMILGHAEAEVQCDEAPATPTPTAGGPTPSPGGPSPTPGGPTPTPGGPTPTPGGPTPTPGGPTPTAGAPTPTPVPTPEPPPGDPGSDPRLNELGLSDDRFAGATLNPGGLGQLLFGPLYDVRGVAGPSGTDSQHVNVQIANTNPLGSESGGVLARVRFREWKTSLEVFAFDLALSCAEVWAGSVFLDGTGTGALPAIRSAMPIVTSIDPTTVVTTPSFDPKNGGATATFSVPSGRTAADVRRGYFEVIAQEQLPCEPIEGSFSKNGNTYVRLTGEAATPPNSLSGLVFLVRARAGVSHAYPMPAISRFVIAGGGSIQAPVESGLPDLGSCVGWDAGSGSEYTGLPDCLNQIDFALSKAHVHAQYDLDASTAARMYLVVTLPTKGYHCDGDAVGEAPFSCDEDGEAIGCRLFDRHEHERPVSCVLPGETTILAVGGPESDPRADVVVDAGTFDAGWVRLDLVSDPSGEGIGVHELRGLDPDRIDFLGVPHTGFRGLPALTILVQEFVNVPRDVFFGNAVEAPYDLELLGENADP